VAIFGLGAMLPEAVRLAAMLRREGFSAAVVNPRFAKPIDRRCVAQYARRCGLLVTLEDHVLAGGFGSAVLETLSELELDVSVVRIGWPDRFIEHGKLEQLRQKYGLTAEAALEKARPTSPRWRAAAWRCDRVSAAPGTTLRIVYRLMILARRGSFQSGTNSGSVYTLARSG